MKIIIDAMGGDNAPDEIVKGAVMAVKEFGVDVILTGRGEDILRAFQKMGMNELPEGVEIANASEVITMEDDPATAARSKRDSSMTVGLQMLHDGKGDAMVSAGSTGALLTGATLFVKRIRGIRRAALAPFFPNKKDGVLVVDCGANVECTPEYLLQFAYMGSFYVEKVGRIAKPRVGLLNIGTEETKGTRLQKDTYSVLKEAGQQGRINFIGNVEARGVSLGDCDVVVCDGFSGNILLKAMEGMGLFILSEIKSMFTKNIFTKIAASVFMKDLKQFRKKADVSEVGGTMLLGISKTVVKAHGSSNAYSIRSAILQAINAVNADVCGEIAANIQYMKLEAEDINHAEP